MAVVSPMPSLKKQKLQKAAAAAMTISGEAEEREKLKSSNNKVNECDNSPEKTRIYEYRVVMKDYS